MKSIFGQITAADLKKGISWIRLNKKDKWFAVALVKTPITVSIVKQILKPRKNFNYGKQ